MKLRLFYSMKQKTLLLLLSALFIIHPIKLFGQQDQKDHFLKIEIKNNRISIDAKNAPLPEVLKKIEKDTGVKMTLHKAADGKRVTAQFKNLDIENALRKILGDNYAFVFSKDKKDKSGLVLKEVTAVSSAFGKDDIASKWKVSIKEFEYGSGKEGVGLEMVRESVDDPDPLYMAPPSFVVDDKGNIWFADRVNDRLQIFSSDGKYVSTISLKGSSGSSVSPLDMAFDKLGYIYVNDGNQLHQYDPSGKIVNSIYLRGEARVLGPMHSIGDNIYKRLDGDLIVGKIKNGVLKELTSEDKQWPYGKGVDIGSSGTGYLVGSTDYPDHSQGEIEILYDGGSSTKTAIFPLKKGEYLSEFLGEDAKGNIYVESALPPKDPQGHYIVAVHMIGKDGSYLGAIVMPENKDPINMEKEYAIGGDGTVYYFVPAYDKARMFIFPPQ